MQKKYKTIKLKTDEIEYLMKLVGNVETTVIQGYPVFELFNKLKKRFEEAAKLDPDYDMVTIED